MAYKMKAFSIDGGKYIQKEISKAGRQSLEELEPHVQKRILKHAERLSFENIFGDNAKKDKDGNYIEQGLGSAAQPTKQSVEAYEKYGFKEAGYVEHLAKMKQALAEFQARKAKEEAEAEAAEEAAELGE